MRGDSGACTLPLNLGEGERRGERAALAAARSSGLLLILGREGVALPCLALRCLYRKRRKQPIMRAAAAAAIQKLPPSMAMRPTAADAARAPAAGGASADARVGVAEGLAKERDAVGDEGIVLVAGEAMEAVGEGVALGLANRLRLRVGEAL